MPGVQQRLRELLPQSILATADIRFLEGAEEIRLRMGLAPSVLISGRERNIINTGITERDIAYVLDRASRSSLHSVSTQLRQGFLQAGFGIRLGVCGSFTEGTLGNANEINSLAIRLPHELRGIGDKAIEKLKPFHCSVLIISPPGGGKTSFLREIIRVSSESGQRVSLCDERGEVAALWRGRTSFDLGPRTDVLSGVEKSRGIMMLLRSMNPNIIAVDEISAEADGPALEQAFCCGAYIYATAHGSGLEEIKKRPHYKRLLEEGLFQRAVIITGSDSRNYSVEDI